MKKSYKTLILIFFSVIFSTSVDPNSVAVAVAAVAFASAAVSELFQLAAAGSRLVFVRRPCFIF